MSKNVMYPAYLSEPAIQTLLKQIPKHELKSIAAELGIDMRILSLKLNLTPNDKKQAIFSQALAVTTYLEKYQSEQIGTIDNPKKYIKGTLPLFSHFLSHRIGMPEFVYFGGSTKQTIVGLTGAANSVYISTQSDIENRNGSRLSSTLPFLLDVLGSDLEINSSRFYMEDRGINLALAFYSMRALVENGQPTASYSFFASVKLDSEYIAPELQPNKHILLASPLYIANAWRI